MGVRTSTYKFWRSVKLIIECFQNPQQTSISVMAKDPEALTADPDNSRSLTDFVQRLVGMLRA